MRIITGQARGTRLVTLEGEATRPTAEMVKEAVFSMIQFDIEGRRMLDLFSGSGQMGLEALSRGAASCDLIDSSAAACAVIKQNAQKTKLFEKCRVLTTDWAAFLRGCKEKYDIVYLDPPYASGLIPKALDLLCAKELAAEGGFVFCESDSDEEFSAPGFSVLRHNKYGRAYITLLKKDRAEE